MLIKLATNKYLLICFIFSFSLISYGQENPDVKDIHTLLSIQEKAWNRGDIDGFMEGYWKSDSLTFIGSRGVTRGWKKTMENYKKSYNTPEKMGMLKFTIEETEIFTPRYATLIGNYKLSSPDGKVFSSGIFSLFFRKINGSWKIIRDHTCG